MACVTARALRSGLLGHQELKSSQQAAAAPLALGGRALSLPPTSSFPPAPQGF